MERIRGAYLNASAQEQIKLFIIEAGLEAGDPIPTEKELESQLGISRSSIREALRSLEALGIVESKHGVGRFLRAFNYDAILENLGYNIHVNVRDFREIIDVRIALESSFIEQVIPRMTAEDFKELYALVDAMQVQVKSGYEDEELIDTHTQFHLKLYEKAQNALLSHLIRVFATVQHTLTLINQYRTSDRLEFPELHRKLVRAMEARDVHLAKRRLLEHFKDVTAWSEEHPEK